MVHNKQWHRLYNLQSIIKMTVLLCYTHTYLCQDHINKLVEKLLHFNSATTVPYCFTLFSFAGSQRNTQPCGLNDNSGFILITSRIGKSTGTPQTRNTCAVPSLKNNMAVYRQH